MNKKNEIARIDDRPKDIDFTISAWKSLAPLTQESYSNDYKLFFDFIKKDVRGVSPHDILAYIEHMEKKGYLNATINRKIASLSKMFKVLLASKKIDVNPMATLTEFQKIIRRTSAQFKVPITVKHVQKAVRIGSQKKQKGQYDKIILIVKALVATGLRISELTGIKNTDIADYDKTTFKIRILGKGNVEDFIFFPKELHAEIKELYPDRPDRKWLFYSKKGRYSRKYLWALIKEFFDTTIGKDVHPHMLRHVYATHKIFIEGHDIKAVSLALRHKNIMTTYRYVDTALDSKDANIKI